MNQWLLRPFRPLCEIQISVCTNKVLLEHRHPLSCTLCLWLVLHCQRCLLTTEWQVTLPNSGCYSATSFWWCFRFCVLPIATFCFFTSAKSSCQNKVFFDCHTSKAQESVHYSINLGGIVFIMQWHYSCDKRMKNPATLPDWALIAVFPTHRRTMVRIRKLKMEYLISAEFPDKNENIQMSLQPNSVSKGLICQLSWPSPMVSALNSIWLQQPTKCIQRKKA